MWNNQSHQFWARRSPLAQPYQMHLSYPSPISRLSPWTTHLSPLFPQLTFLAQGPSRRAISIHLWLSSYGHFLGIQTECNARTGPPGLKRFSRKNQISLVQVFFSASELLFSWLHMCQKFSDETLCWHDTGATLHVSGNGTKKSDSEAIFQEQIFLSSQWVCVCECARARVCVCVLRD